MTGGGSTRETLGEMTCRAKRGRRAFGGFGITTLAPGDYAMRATIMVDGKVVGKATRTIRKTK